MKLKLHDASVRTFFSKLRRRGDNDLPPPLPAPKMSEQSFIEIHSRPSGATIIRQLVGRDVGKAGAMFLSGEAIRSDAVWRFALLRRFVLVVEREMDR